MRCNRGVECVAFDMFSATSSSLRVSLMKRMIIFSEGTENVAIDAIVSRKGRTVDFGEVSRDCACPRLMLGIT